METEPQDFSELNDSSWNEDLFFLCDITSHLNDLNIKLQGKGKLVFDFLDAVNGFRVQIRLFKSQLLKGILTHFSICSQHILLERHFAAGIKYAEQIELLIEEFNNRRTLSRLTRRQRGRVVKAPDSSPTRSRFKTHSRDSVVSWERHFTTHSPAWWSWQAVLNYSRIFINLQADSNILVSPETGPGNCLLLSCESGG